MRSRFILIFLALIFLSFGKLKANNVAVSNVTISDYDFTNNYVLIQFDITWNNSWRNDVGGAGNAAPYNWDAVWIFIKYRVGTGTWGHAYLNDSGHNAPSGSTLDIGLLTPGSAFHTTTNPGLGAFLYRDANGTGTFTKTGVKLRWNYGANGLSDSDIVDYDVYATEMVYVPQGTFNLGDNEGNTNGSFYVKPSASPYLAYSVSSEAAINVGTTNGYLYYEDGIGGRDIGDQSGPIPANFPKGYNAFYCMKYEITQSAYVRFLNTLNYTQQATRTATAPSSAAGTGALKSTNADRNGIDIKTSGVNSGTPAVYACNLDGDGNYNEANDGACVAVNYFKWQDLASYLDWSGLRPMTELEYEKACRGTITTGPKWEYAWGSTAVAASTYTISSSGDSAEVIATNYSGTNGNCMYSSTSGTIGGPTRVGIMATGSSTRVLSGAAYYGIFDMSGNVFEFGVTIGDATGRAYTGVHGNGFLDATGNSDVSNWPGTGSSGVSARGGMWGNSASFMRISDRYIGTVGSHGYGDATSRDSWAGGRGVRTAP